MKFYHGTSEENWNKIQKEGVPLTIIGDEYFLGFSETNANLMENNNLDTQISTVGDGLSISIVKTCWNF